MTKAKFTEFFEGLGFSDIRVVLSSGNIIFESDQTDTDALAKHIEGAMSSKLGYSRSAIVRSKAELQHIIDLDPYKGIEQDHNKEKYLLITFFRHDFSLPFSLPYTPSNKPFTILGQIDNAIYGTISLTSGKTPDYMSWLEKQFGKDITSRTPKTIRLILSRM
jgi:uncharacterized protein (DUF1697 family)